MKEKIIRKPLKYKDALRNKPSDEETRYNYALAKRCWKKIRLRRTKGYKKGQRQKKIRTRKTKIKKDKDKDKKDDKGDDKDKDKKRRREQGW
jgi:hypothetical protein